MFKLKMLFVFFLILFGNNFVFSNIIQELPIVVLITSYNNKKWINQNLHSIFIQKYSNYRVVYVDDCSTDSTADLVESFTALYQQQSRFKLIRNLERKGALANIYEAVHDCLDNEIIVSVDGDDWLAHDSVLAKLNQYYSSRNIWLTHGSFKEHPSQNTSWSLKIPSGIVEKNAFRKYRCPSHLRTFYAWLFKKIVLDDLQYNNQFYWMTWDQAIMFPMIEMAGDRHAFISEVFYIYNMENPINDNKVDPQLQVNLEKLIRAKQPYKKLP